LGAFRPSHIVDLGLGIDRLDAIGQGAAVEPVLQLAVLWAKKAAHFRTPKFKA
jgi:hypothetical protein